MTATEVWQVSKNSLFNLLNGPEARYVVREGPGHIHNCTILCLKDALSQGNTVLLTTGSQRSIPLEPHSLNNAKMHVNVESSKLLLWS